MLINREEKTKPTNTKKDNILNFNSLSKTRCKNIKKKKKRDGEKNSKPVTQAKSEKKNNSHSWKIQHVIVLWQSMNFHSPQIWIIFPKCIAQILCKIPCHRGVGQYILHQYICPSKIPHKFSCVIISQAKTCVIRMKLNSKVVVERGEHEK